MKAEQFSEYQRISEEMEPVKQFLASCGTKYHENGRCRPFFDLICRNPKFFLYRKLHFGSVEDNLFEIPRDLQDRIIETVERWVDEKEDELSKI